MNFRTITARSLAPFLVLLALAACHVPELATGRSWLGIGEDRGLRLHGDEEAGRPPERPYLSLTAEERDALAGAQALDPTLAEQRAGDLSDREIKIILITVGAVILLVILL